MELKYLLLFIAGVIAGFINTLAGSGSLLTLPVLMMLGLSPTQANATNRIAVFFQSLTGVKQFKKYGHLNIKEALRYTLPAIVGSIAGAFLAVDINDKVMHGVILGLMLFMFFVVLLKPDKWIKDHAGEQLPKPGFVQLAVMFAIGFYGGFIQAGVGFFLLAGLVLGAGADLIKANGIKLFVVFAYTPVAIIIFIMNDLMDYKLGLILALGNVAGALAGSKLSTHPNAQQITRFVLLFSLLLASAKLVFDIL